MKIQDQVIEAKKFTDDLLKLILKTNRYKLNKDGQGCSLNSIHISYSTDKTTIETGFISQDNLEVPITSFYCRSTEYD